MISKQTSDRPYSREGEVAFGWETEDRVTDLRGGANQIRVRAYNERLVLSLVRRHRYLPKSEIARRSGLSPQTVSVIMRALEADGLLIRGEPQRGRVGQPSIPMSLDPDGAYSIGLKIGRRSADLVLMDFTGGIRGQLNEVYNFPVPDQITEFVKNGIAELTAEMKTVQRAKITGIGIATPFELWNWAEEIGEDPSHMEAWKNIDLVEVVGEVVPYPVYLQNDATAACGAELVFGRGSEFSDFVYFFVGTFIGGGIVLNQTLYSGRAGNAGAFGPMPIPGRSGQPAKLIDKASIVTLERMLVDKGIDPEPLWLDPDGWDDLGDSLDIWIEGTARALAVAVAAACSTIDFQAAIIDGGFPASIRKRLVAAIRNGIAELDLRGIVAPEIVEGSIGAGARALGGACLPLFERYLLDQNVLFKETAA